MRRELLIAALHVTEFHPSLFPLDIGLISAWSLPADIALQHLPRPALTSSFNVLPASRFLLPASQPTCRLQIRWYLQAIWALRQKRREIDDSQGLASGPKAGRLVCRSLLDPAT